MERESTRYKIEGHEVFTGDEITFQANGEEGYGTVTWCTEKQAYILNCGKPESIRYSLLVFACLPHRVTKIARDNVVVYQK